MIEDDDDKIRRNLVLVSSFILICGWLGISEISFIEKFISQSVPLSSWKVASLFLVIVLYLSLRFRFADGTKKDYGRLIGEWNAIRISNVDKRIKNLLKTFTKSHKDSNVFTPKLSAYFKEQATDSVISNRSDWNLISLEATRVEAKDAWSGEVRMAIALGTNDGYTSSRAGGNSISYSFVGFERYRVLALSALKLVTYTKGAIDFIAPIVLAVLAVLFLTYKLLKDVNSF